MPYGSQCSSERCGLIVYVCRIDGWKRKASVERKSRRWRWVGMFG
jgi:hypothetical protein